MNPSAATTAKLRHMHRRHLRATLWGEPAFCRQLKWVGNTYFQDHGGLFLHICGCEKNRESHASNKYRWQPLTCTNIFVESQCQGVHVHVWWCLCNTYIITVLRHNGNGLHCRSTSLHALYLRVFHPSVVLVSFILAHDGGRSVPVSLGRIGVGISACFSQKSS